MRSRAPSLAFALTLVLLGGCRDASQVDENTPLRFWNGFSGPDGSTMKGIVTSYNDANPDAKFDMQIIPWGTYYDKVTLGMAFGGAPDVFISHASRLPQYAEAGALEPLAPMFGKSGLKPSDYVPAAFQCGFWKGVQYGIPLDCWPLTLYYNKRLFREAGIEKPPTNLEEFLSAAKKLTKRDSNGKVTQWGFALTELHNNVLTFMDQHGGNVINADGTKSALDSPESIAAIEQVRSFFTSEGIAPNPEGANAWDAFKIGKAAMVMQGIYMISDLQKQEDLEYGAAPVPQFGPKRSVWGGSHMLVMPKGLSAARKAKAWQLMKYLSDNSLRWAGAGQCPVRVSVLESPEFRKMEGQYQASRQLSYVQNEAQTPMIGQVSSFADAAWESILMSGEPARPALKTASRRIDAVLERQ